MRSEEVVLRSLVREWIILEKAKEKNEKMPSVSLSDVESIDDKLEDILSKIKNKIESKNESITALGIGSILSIPALVKITSQVTGAIIRTIAGFTSLFPKIKQHDLESRARVIEKAGLNFWNEWHHTTVHVYKNILKAFFMLLVSTGGEQSANLAQVYVDSKEGKIMFEKMAVALDFAVTCNLAVYSIEGFAEAAHEGYKGLAGYEALLAYIKAGHIAEASAAAIANVTNMFQKTFDYAEIAVAQTHDAIEKGKMFFNLIKEDIEKGRLTIKKAIVFAGINIALTVGAHKDPESRISKHKHHYHKKISNKDEDEDKDLDDIEPIDDIK
jgi:uncharacterized protein YaaR (DUF327 family)